MLHTKKEQLLHLLRDRQGLTPSEIWKALRVTNQSAAHILQPQLNAKLVKRVGTCRNGIYVLA